MKIIVDEKPLKIEDHGDRTIYGNKKAYRKFGFNYYTKEYEFTGYVTKRTKKEMSKGIYLDCWSQTSELLLNRPENFVQL